MNDVVVLQLINSLFWLLMFGAALFFFRKEIRKLLQSLGSFRVAGSSFEFKDTKETIQSYILLSETLIDLLSRSDRIDALQQILVPSQIEKLSAFALKYTDEIDRTSWNEEMLRNIAYLLLRFGRYTQAVSLYDALLAGRPEHVDLLNLKALALITSRLKEQVEQALPILAELVRRYPELHYIRFNYALAKSLVYDHEGAVEEMEKVICSDYLKQNQQLLHDVLFQKTREESPESFGKLQKLVESELKQGPNDKD